MPRALTDTNSENTDTVLDRYLQKLQKTPLDYRFIKSKQVDNLTLKTYQLTSQNWSPNNLVSPAQWTHELTVYSPDQSKRKTALLVVNNGSNVPKKEVTDFVPETLIGIAQKSQTIVISVSNVPNQGLDYAGGKKPLAEDYSVAKSWRLYMDQVLDKTQEYDFLPLHIPMMGAVIKSMDVAQAVLKEQGIDEFILTGISKRGWAAWLAALADERITAFFKRSVLI